MSSLRCACGYHIGLLGHTAGDRIRCPGCYEWRIVPGEAPAASEMLVGAGPDLDMASLATTDAAPSSPGTLAPPGPSPVATVATSGPAGRPEPDPGLGPLAPEGTAAVQVGAGSFPPVTQPNGRSLTIAGAVLSCVGSSLFFLTGGLTVIGSGAALLGVILGGLSCTFRPGLVIASGVVQTCLAVFTCPPLFLVAGLLALSKTFAFAGPVVVLGQGYTVGGLGQLLFYLFADSVWALIYLCVQLLISALGAIFCLVGGVRLQSARTQAPLGMR